MDLKDNLTDEQHFQNIAFAINHGSLTISNADKANVVGSFNFLYQKYVKEPEKKVKKK